MLFCIPDDDTPPNLRREELESLLPSICKELGKRGMTTLKQWDKYISEHPDGYGLTQFRHTTDPQHLCPKHRAIAEWSPETFIA